MDKTMRVIRRHIIHCSDSLAGDVATIRQWHKARGWVDVGYHFIIRRDGEIEVGRMLSDVGAHCAGENFDSIGTCLVGKADFDPRQIAALKRLHGALKLLFPAMSVHGHREFNPHKTCPNFEVKDVVR